MKRISRIVLLAVVVAGAFGVGQATAYDPEPAFAAKLNACLIVREAVRLGYDPTLALPATLKVCRTHVRGVPGPHGIGR